MGKTISLSAQRHKLKKTTRNGMETAQLQHATQQIIIYFGSFTIILGVIGNTLNAIIFANVRATFARNFCSRYFIVTAITDSLCLLIGLLSKILSNGFAIDPTVSSIVFCKFRNFFVNTAPLISTSFICLAAITQFFVTSRHASYRQKISLRLVRWTILFTVLFWTLHGLPYIILYTIRLSATTNMPVCNSVNLIFNQYAAWMTYNILIFMVPILILVVFGYLTYRNIASTKPAPLNQQRATGQRIQQQLTVVSHIYCIFDFQPYLFFSLLS
jgi:hypothetical protein